MHRSDTSDLIPSLATSSEHSSALLSQDHAPPSQVQDVGPEEPIWAVPIFDANMLSQENIPPAKPKHFHVMSVSSHSDPPEIQSSLEEAPTPTPPEEAEPVAEAPPSEASEGDASNTPTDCWERLQVCQDQHQTLKAEVTGYNKGGLLVSLYDLQGFVPASQLVHFPRHLDTSAREAYLAQQKGSNLGLKIIELDKERNRLVLSERACILDHGQGKDFLNTLQSGDVIDGLVSNLCEFGAFVDLGGIDGLIHVSEISWQRINHPQDVLEIGQKVRVYVLSVDSAQKRIALSLKRLSKDPWQTIENRYHVGQVVQGTITNIVDFGAFARIEDGLEGLIHISEIADEQINHPEQVLAEGQDVDVRILRIDGANHRLGLSLRQAADPFAGPGF
jgi:predicted RNA-binding protein with RPS1 domain